MNGLKTFLLNLVQAFLALFQPKSPESLTGPPTLKPLPENTANSPAWLRLARSYIGQKEILGSRDNQFITDCFSFTSYPMEGIHDEIPWCAAFVCRCLAEAGYKHTHNAAAVSYSSYGNKSELVPGAIIVFKWASGGHHVTFLDSVNGDYVNCCGGNQSNEVKVSTYSKKYIESVRWPV